MFPCFLKNAIFIPQKIVCFSQLPKSTIFLGLFWICPFPFFHLFSFIQHKKDKNKKCTFFRKHFLTPWETAKKYFRTPTHYLCFLRHPQHTMKLGENRQKSLWQIFDATLDRFSTLQHIYIYARGKVKSWSKICLYKLKKLVLFFCFLLFISKISFSLQKEEDKKTSKNNNNNKTTFV